VEFVLDRSQVKPPPWPQSGAVFCFVTLAFRRLSFSGALSAFEQPETPSHTCPANLHRQLTDPKQQTTFSLWKMTCSL
jgi:hypothetical protein